ncbi:hypothetical protein F0562_035578 [Nyssa sinensis]|uniref:Uncharacterized protein n=1 Tax=Nyssa sinensis TaxID=561372 RepID=A0A5J5AG44_9ASTE|nr:hypothetical protein F0562_035578 [Nyssa sinensis]
MSSKNKGFSKTKDPAKAALAAAIFSLLFLVSLFSSLNFMFRSGAYVLVDLKVLTLQISKPQQQLHEMTIKITNDRGDEFPLRI